MCGPAGCGPSPGPQPEKKACIFCETGNENHEACVRAYGLDYDPTSEQDAKDFLERRRNILEDTP